MPIAALYVVIRPLRRGRGEAARVDAQFLSEQKAEAGVDVERVAAQARAGDRKRRPGATPLRDARSVEIADAGLAGDPLYSPSLPPSEFLSTF